MNSIIKYRIFEEFNKIIQGSTTKKTTFEKCLRELKCKTNNTIIPKQIHGNDVIIASTGMTGKDIDYYEGDSLLTNQKDVTLVIRTADCVPIFIYDKSNNAIGLIHAGWRGLSKDIIGCFIEKMKQTYNTNTNAIFAAIGPCINKKCYEVKHDVLNELNKIYNHYINDVTEIKDDNSWYLDLKLLSKRRLLDLGVEENNIEVSNYCTHCNDDLFYSFRRDKAKLGNVYSIMSLKS